MGLDALVARLRRAAEAANERRLLVLAGDRAAGIDAAYDAIDAFGVADGDVCLLTTAEGFRFDRLHPDHADRLLGTTRRLVVLDCHEGFSPNALGRAAGVVDGGGLFVLLTPPIEAIPTGLSALVDRVAVPPFPDDAVGNRFRRRLAGTLETHPGVAVVDVAASSPRVVRGGEIESGSGRAAVPTRATGSRPPSARSVEHSVARPDGPFPTAAYRACLTGDQARALDRLSALAEPGHAVVVEADRGRGKSSAAGLAVGSFVAAGDDVVVTAPGVENAAEVFARAADLLADLDCLTADAAGDRTKGVATGGVATDGVAAGGPEADRTLTSTTGGRLRFLPPARAARVASEVDCVVVDEAAAVSVRLLESLLAAPSIGFCTTVRGYEGTGRGFAVRFRDRLADSAHRVIDVTLEEPIRYARGDPVESWLFRTLLLDAAPPVAQLVADATPESVDYRRLDRESLAADEPRLRAVFGLLVAAHYRTEPTDLLRLLDAPNVVVRALTHEGHVVSVALLAREGGLDADTRERIYRGERVRGNMLPDVLTSQLRDPEAAAPVGYRVMRIATHHAARSRGLGSLLLERCHVEFGDRVDWFGVGYGATPRLLSFWCANDYRTVHLSTTPNEASGERSALMLRPTSPAGRALTDRHVGWFRDRIGDVLGDALSTLPADVVRGALRAARPVDATPSAEAGTGDADAAAADTVDADDAAAGDTAVGDDSLGSLGERDWRVLAGVAYGPGTYETAPGVFRTLALAHLFEPLADLSARQERLLVRKVLQGASWESVADELGYHSPSGPMRELGTIARRFCAAVGGRVVADERTRYED